MLTIKISELGAINSLADEDILPVVDISDSTTKKVTAAQIRDFLLTTLAPGSVVVSGTSFGVEPAVGTSLAYARADHSHGTPPDPMPDHLAALDPHNGYLLASGARALAGNWSAGAHRIMSLATPVALTDAVNKAYVDSKVQGLDWQESVKSRLNDPPASPAAMARYLIDTAPTGDWVGHADEIATWNGVTWGFETPSDGWATWIEDVDILRVFNGTAWVTFGSTSDHGALSGLLDDDHTQYFLADGTRNLGGALTVDGVSPPDLAPASTGRIYFDATASKFRVSEDGNDYVDLLTGGTVTSVVGESPLSTGGTATDPTITFPSWPPDAAGLLTNDGSGGLSWSAPLAPATPNNSIQYNNGGAFGGTAALTWDGSYIHVGSPSGQEGLLSNNVVRFVANPAVPSLGGNEAGLGWDISVGALPALYLKLGGTGDTAIMQLQGPLGISPGLSLRYTRGGPDDKPFWIDADGGPIRIGNNSDYYTTTKVILGSASTPVRISDAFDLPMADGAPNKVLRTDGLGGVSWSDEVLGIVPVANGGTGSSLPLLSFGSMLYADSSSSLTSFPLGPAGYFMKSNGGTPTWDQIQFTDITGTLAVDKGGTGVTSLAANGALVMGFFGTQVESKLGSSLGDVLTWNGTTWAAAAPSVTAPATPNNSIQYNNAGAFGGSADLTWDGTGLAINGALTKTGVAAFSLSTETSSQIAVANGKLDITVTLNRLKQYGYAGLELRTDYLIEARADIVLAAPSGSDPVSADAMSSNTLTDNTQSWGVNALVGQYIEVALALANDGPPEPSGVVVSGVIASNTATEITVTSPWEDFGPVYTYTIHSAQLRVRNVADPDYPQDVATKHSVEEYVAANVTTTAITTYNSNGPIDRNQGTILVDASVNVVVLILPDASLCPGQAFVIKKIDTSANKVIVGAYGYDDGDIPDQYIDGSTSYELRNQYEAVKVQSNGTQFWII